MADRLDGAAQRLRGHLQANPGRTSPDEPSAPARSETREAGDDPEHPFAEDHQAHMAYQSLRAVLADRARRPAE